MALETIFIENRLNVAHVVDNIGNALDGFQIDRLGISRQLGEPDSVVLSRRLASVFMAPDATVLLARHDRRKGVHSLNAPSVFVERDEEEGA